MTPKPGEWWTHHKGQKYKIVRVGRCADLPDAPLVVIYEDVKGGFWTRLLIRWHDEQREGVPRFRREEK